MANVFDPAKGLSFKFSAAEIAKDEEGRTFVQQDDMKYFIDYTEVAPGEIPPIGLEPYAIRGGNKWPAGKPIRIIFEAGLNAGRKDLIKQALAKWSSVTSVRFSEASTDNDCMYFAAGSTNDAPVGHYPGYGRHTIRILSWEVPTIAHEVGHSLGLEHEHQRSDAATYITVNSANLTDFGKATFAPTNGTLVTAYDLRSIMHYAPRLGDKKFVIDPDQPAFFVNPPNEGMTNQVGIKRISASDAAAIG